MNNLQSMKEKLDSLSDKNHVLSQEALFAKAVTEEDALQKREEDIARSERQAQLMQEFQQSISLLMKIFKESQFDTVMAMVADPLRLLIVNFFVSVIKGMGFAIGALVIFVIVASVFPGFLF